MTLSSAFADGATIPTEFTCFGDDHSPPLEWSNVPAKAKSLAMVVKDPDAPGGTFVHWVLYNLPPKTKGLGVSDPLNLSVRGGATQGTNGFGARGYRGPCPPPGAPHHYHFVLYALDKQLQLDPGATEEEFERAASAHVIAAAELVGVFQR